jgi:nucleoporin SEH1
MDIRTTDNLYPTLALIDRQGLLSVYEPANPDHFKEWSLVDAFNVCGSSPPGRGEETSFKVRFDQNPTPLAYVNGFSDDRTQLSLVVSALNDVKIYRAITSYSGDNPPGDGASHRLAFYEAIRLHPHPALVRDVQWASFSVRGTDRIATACKDGAIRIFELGVAEALETTANDAADRTETSHMTSVPRSAQPVAQRQQPQSSLTTGLTGRAHPNSSNTPFLPAASPTPARAARTGHSFSFVTNIQSMTLLANAHTDAWSLSFDGQGQVLMSNGSDGVTKLWRKSVLGGQWLMFAGQEVLDLGEETDGEEEDEDEGADSD